MANINDKYRFTCLTTIGTLTRMLVDVKDERIKDLVKQTLEAELRIMGLDQRRILEAHARHMRKGKTLQ